MSQATSCVLIVLFLNLFSFVAGKRSSALNAESTVRTILYKSNLSLHVRVFRKNAKIFVHVFSVVAKLFVLKQSPCVPEPYMNDLQV